MQTDSAKDLTPSQRQRPPIELTPKALRHRLLREVWGASHVHERNHLYMFVQRLRQKLEDDPRSPRVILSAGSRGYRLGGPTDP